jgi:hypothetical protein
MSVTSSRWTADAWEPVSIRCSWVSMNPGSMVRPPRSSVGHPWSIRGDSVACMPTATIRPFSTARALQRVSSASMQMMLALTMSSRFAHGFMPAFSCWKFSVDPVDQLNDAAGEKEDGGTDQPAEDRQAQGAGQSQELVAEDDYSRAEHRPHERADAAQLHHGDGQQKGLDGQGGRRDVAQVVNIKPAAKTGHEGDHHKHLDLLPYSLMPSAVANSLLSRRATKARPVDELMIHQMAPWIRMKKQKRYNRPAPG